MLYSLQFIFITSMIHCCLFIQYTFYLNLFTKKCEFTIQQSQRYGMHAVKVNSKHTTLVQYVQTFSLESRHCRQFDMLWPRVKRFSLKPVNCHKRMWRNSCEEILIAPPLHQLVKRRDLNVGRNSSFQKLTKLFIKILLPVINAKRFTSTLPSTKQAHMRQF